MSTIIATAPVPAGCNLAEVQTIALEKVRPAPPRVVPISSDDPDNPHTSEWSEGYLQGVNEAREFFGVADAWMAGFKRGTEEPRQTSPVWPPQSCPSWCSYVDDPADHVEKWGPVHQDDRTHLHDHYRCVPAAARDNLDGPEPGTVELSLEKLHHYSNGGNQRTAHQHLSVEMGLHYREAEPTLRVVHLGETHDSQTSNFAMTLIEAQQLAELLAHLVELGRQP